MHIKVKISTNPSLVFKIVDRLHIQKSVVLIRKTQVIATSFQVRLLANKILYVVIIMLIKTDSTYLKRRRRVGLYRYIKYNKID